MAFISSLFKMAFSADEIEEEDFDSDETGSESSNEIADTAVEKKSPTFSIKKFSHLNREEDSVVDVDIESMSAKTSVVSDEDGADEIYISKAEAKAEIAREYGVSGLEYRRQESACNPDDFCGRRRKVISDSDFISLKDFRNTGKRNSAFEFSGGKASDDSSFGISWESSPSNGASYRAAANRVTGPAAPMPSYSSLISDREKSAISEPKAATGKISIAAPKTIKEAEYFADAIRNGDTVILKLNEIASGSDRKTASKDYYTVRGFMFGVAYENKRMVEPVVKDWVYIIAPQNINISELISSSATAL